MKRRTEEVELTNMCVVEDRAGNAVAINKVTGNYRGITFPGGHVEEKELFCDSVIREVYEETGLRIQNPRLCGVYHWYREEVHNILFVYHATEYTGTLKSSREGKVYWAPLKELKKENLAVGSDKVIELIEQEGMRECIMRRRGDTYAGELF